MFVHGRRLWEGKIGDLNETVEPADTSLAFMFFFQVLLLVIAIGLFFGLSACGTFRSGMRRPRLYVGVTAVMRGALQSIH